MSKARNYVFTTFGCPSEEDETGGAPRLIYEADLPSWITYFVYQLELAPETGRLHFQGYLECMGQQTMSRIEALPFFAGRTHLSVRRGTQSQAIAYATKGDTRVDGPWFYGTPKVCSCHMFT